MRYALATILMLAAVPAKAVVMNINTGTAAWTVTQVSGIDNGFGIGSSTAAVVLVGTLPFAANLPGFEAFAWANPFGGAVWIGQAATDGQFSNGGSITCGTPCGATAGFYRYDLSFDASLGGSLNLAGFTADNGVRSLMVSQANVGTLYSCTASGPGTLCAATQTAVTAASGNLALSTVPGGQVTISAMVENLNGPGRNPSGFILAGSAVLNERPSTVPEPSAWAMLIMGFGLTGAAMRKRRADQRLRNAMNARPRLFNSASW
jgi:hypothetical protein